MEIKNSQHQIEGLFATCLLRIKKLLRQFKLCYESHHLVFEHRNMCCLNSPVSVLMGFSFFLLLKEENKNNLSS
jgi:hypothetical protein